MPGRRGEKDNAIVFSILQASSQLETLLFWSECPVSNKGAFPLFMETCTFPIWGPKSKVEGKDIGCIMGSIQSVHSRCHLVCKDLGIYL